MNRNLLLSKIAASLQVSQVSGDDNFFDLGGDSLAALELAEVLSRGLGRNVGVDEIVTAPDFNALLTIAPPPK